MYLPLIWEPQFCFKSPIALGYTRGHFTALVPFEKSEVISYMACNNYENEDEHDPEKNNVCGGSNIDSSDFAATSSKNNTNNTSNSATILGAVSNLDNTSESQQQQQQIFYLPLANNEGHLLPVHFLTSSELGRERSILKQYLNMDCIVMQGSNCGLLVAQQRVAKRGMLVTRMLEEWLSYYKNMQAKEYGRQIELSQEKEQTTSDEFVKLGGSGGVAVETNSVSMSLPQTEAEEGVEEEDEDEEDREDSGDEDDEDSPDDDDDEDNESANEEEDYDDDDDYAEVEVQ